MLCGVLKGDLWRFEIHPVSACGLPMFTGNKLNKLDALT
jgi:hypothetical protein